jgi:hypothetical protein
MICIIAGILTSVGQQPGSPLDPLFDVPFLTSADPETIPRATLDLALPVPRIGSIEAQSYPEKSTKRKRPECFSGLSSKKVELRIKK